MSKNPLALAPIPAAPKLKTGDDEAVAARFEALLKDAQSAWPRIAAFALYAFDVKFNQLKHGQFGTWVKAHHGESGYRIVRGHMRIIECALHDSGVKSIKRWIKQIAGQIGSTLPICHSGELFLIEDAKLPPKLRTVRQKFFDIVDGKSQRQLFAEFKQADNDAETPKRGRIKGHGGATAAQREAAQQHEEAARLEAIQLRRDEVKSWLLKVSDDQHLGQLPPDPEFLEALETAAGYLRRLAKKGAAA